MELRLRRLESVSPRGESWIEDVLEHFPGPSLEGCWEETCVCPETYLIREVTEERGLKMARFYQSGVRVPRLSHQGECTRGPCLQNEEGTALIWNIFWLSPVNLKSKGETVQTASKQFY